MNWPIDFLNKVICGDNIEIMRAMPDSCVDAVVTDPPYGLAFMGKHWDYDVPTVEIWKECLRVLKPGGHLLSFSGTRTYHRMAVNIEDAGFEIRDMIAWVYGSGFPKSLNVGIAIEKQIGGMGPRGKAFVTAGIGDREDIKNTVGWEENKPVSFKTPEAKQWHGWGTALKPALEPICVARKPLVGTVAENVLQYGTGAMNIDGCRISAKQGEYDIRHYENEDCFQNLTPKKSRFQVKPQPPGRWPANLIHDGSVEVVELFPENSGAFAPVKAGQKGFGGEIYGRFQTAGDDGRTFYNDGPCSAARFFYCPKASKEDRGDDNSHCTVKPTDLMRYLCRLVTPPDGIILDPFFGSGSTGKAARLEYFNYIGIEREKEYCEIATKRIAAAIPNRKLEFK